MTNESILKDADGIFEEFATPEKAAESVKLKVWLWLGQPSMIPVYGFPVAIARTSREGVGDRGDICLEESQLSRVSKFIKTQGMYV